MPVQLTAAQIRRRQICRGRGQRARGATFARVCETHEGIILPACEACPGASRGPKEGKM